MIDPQTGEYLSEDYAFCRRWLDMGGEIWARSDSRLTHLGTYAFEGDLLRAMRQVKKAIDERGER
jgi:hypothetical protein